MKALQLFILVIFAAYFAGCASVAPQELVDARSAYQIASAGSAQELAPVELRKAQLALGEAEQSFLRESDSTITKDLSYVAQRKSEQAGALGAIAAAKATKDRANADFQKLQSAIVEQGKKDLSESEQQTAAVEAELARQSEIKATKAETDAEFQWQQARIEQGKRDVNDAEKRAAASKAELDKQLALTAAKNTADAELKASEQRTAAALAELAAIASLKEEERGLVLTLSGSILFRSAESTVMPAAQSKLDQVKKALLTIGPRSLIVEGHTDSQGSDAYNQALSQRRADAVRNYLVLKGYPANQILAHGQGEGSPIAKNSSAEGRANNRRVEIVIQRELQSSSTNP